MLISLKLNLEKHDFKSIDFQNQSADFYSDAVLVDWFCFSTCWFFLNCSFTHEIVDMRSQGGLLLEDLMKIEWSSFELSWSHNNCIEAYIDEGKEIWWYP